MHTKAKRKHRFHLNTLWSIWYGILFTYFQGYLILNGAYRFLGKKEKHATLFQWIRNFRDENENLWNEQKKNKRTNAKKKIHFRHRLKSWKHSLNVEIMNGSGMLNTTQMITEFSFQFVFSLFPLIFSSAHQFCTHATYEYEFESNQKKTNKWFGD